MRYPNLRYGNPEEFRYYVEFLPQDDRLKLLSRRLRRDERTIRDWLSGRKKIPWWVPEIMRLKRMESAERMRQMNMAPVLRNFGIVRGEVIEFGDPTQRLIKPAPTIYDLRREEFDQPRQCAAG